jgi:hypothetical protein
VRGVEPAKHPETERERSINPVVRIFVFAFTFGRLATREAVWPMVFVSGYVDEFEVEEENRGDPAIDRRVGLNVGVMQHAFDELGVHLDHQMADPNEVNAEGAESPEETVEFEFGLRVTSLALIPRYRAETGRAALIV